MTAWFKGLKTRTKLAPRSRDLPRDPVLVGIAFPSAGSEQRLQAPERVQARHVDPTQIGPIDLNQQGRAVPVARRGAHLRDDDLHRAAHAAAAEPGADGRRGALPADARQHHRQRTWTTSMAAKWFPFIGTLFLFILFSNLIGYIPLPTNTEHKINVFGVADPVLLALRGDRQPLDPARARARRVRLLPRRRHPRQGPHRLPEGLVPGGRARRDGACSIFFLEVLSQPHADHLAVDPTVREHPRRAPDHPVHGAARSPCSSGSPRSAGSRSRSASPSSSSRSAWWPPCRRSSSPPSPLSTSAARSPSHH